MQLLAEQGRDIDQGAVRAQSRVRLHQVLETERGAVLTGRSRRARQLERQGERQQARGRGSQGNDPAACLQGVRRAHVWPDREQGPSAVRIRFHSHRALERAGLGAA